jgi:hypothetical protein
VVHDRWNTNHASSTKRGPNAPFYSAALIRHYHHMKDVQLCHWDAGWARDILWAIWLWDIGKREA